MILVAGATGNVGAELVRVLAATGGPVRALSRRPGSAALPAGVTSVRGDLNDPDSLADALNGARGMFALSGYRDMPGLLRRAREAACAGRAVVRQLGRRARS